MARPKLNCIEKFPFKGINLTPKSNDNNSNSSFDIFENVYNSMRLPSISSPTIPPVLSNPESLSNKVEAIITQYFSAITVGACLGASITAGILVGTHACSSFLSFMGSSNKTPWYGFFSSKHEREQEERNTKISILLTQPDVSFPHNMKSSEEQCLECIKNLGLKLVNHNKQWHQIKKITIYLCMDGCSSQTFRNAWNEYLKSKGMMQNENIVLVFVFVQRLEEEHANVQLEALIC